MDIDSEINSDTEETSANKLALQWRWFLTSVLLVVIQICVLIPQQYQLSIYESEVEQYMPTMSTLGRSNSITQRYWVFAVILPAVSALILCPFALFSLDRSRAFRNKIYIASVCGAILGASIVCGILAAFFALAGFGNYVGTFD